VIAGAVGRLHNVAGSLPTRGRCHAPLRAPLRALLACWLGLPICVGAQVPSRPPVTASAPTKVAARVIGTVYDSVSMRALSNATVRIVRTDDPSVGRSASSDIYGRFRVDSLPAGTWIASFLHPTLDSLRLEPGVVRIDIAEAGDIDLPLTIPSSRTLIAFSCRALLAADAGVIVGDVRRSDDDAPLVGASVFVEWPEWVLQQKRMVTDMRRVTARTDSLGHFTLCGVPTGSSLRTFAWTSTDTSGAIEVAVPEHGYALQDFAIGTVERVTVRLDSVTGPAALTTVRRGRATVRGVVQTLDGRPLPNAVVRVLGSGSQVRSNATGAFTIADAAPGTQSVEARAIGYAPLRLPLRLRDGEVTPTTLRLALQRVQLDTVRVTAGKTIRPEVLAIERRMRTGTGTILDANAIWERSTLFVSDALRRINGVSVVGAGYGQKIFMRSPFNGAECLANIIIDGLAARSASSGDFVLDDFVSRENVAAIEVYPRANLVPGEFLTQAGGCGVVAIWTKQATGGVLPRPAKPSTP
jgi:Carboxypeptidase regulatory-like domain